jgi:hypothetical protein
MPNKVCVRVTAFVLNGNETNAAFDHSSGQQTRTIKKGLVGFVTEYRNLFHDLFI